MYRVGHCLYSAYRFFVTENVIRSVYQCAFHDDLIKIKVFGISLQTVCCVWMHTLFYK